MLSAHAAKVALNYVYDIVLPPEFVVAIWCSLIKKNTLQYWIRFISVMSKLITKYLKKFLNFLNLTVQTTTNTTTFLYYVHHSVQKIFNLDVQMRYENGFFSKHGKQ